MHMEQEGHLQTVFVGDIEGVPGCGACRRMYGVRDILPDYAAAYEAVLCGNGYLSGYVKLE